MNNKLQTIRNEITAIDNDILNLISARSTLLTDILTVKSANALGSEICVFDPKQEQYKIDCLTEKNSSQFSDKDIATIFQAIISASRNLQIDRAENAEPFQVSIQGTKGSYSELAMLKYCQQKSIQHYKVNYAISSHNVLCDIHSGRVRYGIIALNNAQGGLVNETIKALTDHKYLIVDSIVLLVEHSLIVLEGADQSQLKQIYSHPQALKQMSRNISANLFLMSHNIHGVIRHWQ